MTTVLDTRHRHPAPPSQARGSRAAQLPRQKAITVNGVTIPRAHIARETQHHPSAKPIDAWWSAARALVVRELLLQEARRSGIVPLTSSDEKGRRETDEEALIRQLIERDVVVPQADEATCRRIYDQRRESFRSADLYAVRHILLAADPADAEARAGARRRAAAIIDELSSNPALFPQLAATVSACPSAGNGGQLGQISRGQTVPEFEAALADAPIGSVAPAPIETRYGMHVVVVDQRIDGRDLPFEVVRDTIAGWLTRRCHDTAVRQYIAMLAGQATITGIELGASASPLFQ